MKVTKYIYVLLIFILMLSGCSNSSSVDVENEIPTDDTVNIDEDLGVAQELDQDEKEKVSEGFTVNDRQFHNIEFHGDKIYALYDWENPENEDEWSDALWCFSPYEEARMIAEGKGLQFRVTEDGELIAVEVEDNIDIYDAEGKLLHRISEEDVNTEEYTSVSLEQWNDDGSVLWCSLMETYVTVAYIAIDTDSWESTKYNDQRFGSDEYVLNPNTGWIAYSDYPVTLDIIAFDDYMESGEMTTLFVYNLMTKEERVVDSSETNKFKPSWSDNRNELVYYKGYKSYSYDMDAE